ncbi:aconitase family protein [Jeongeupia wiesaeckerbachi]|uniref:aconitase family protein n=1 Tax=Jeongeupia wiesaeckerbachi TaxID=3051218 RepID=UPI003D804C2C
MLLLCADPDQIEEQLQGGELSLAEAGPLRDDVSTDEITPIPVLGHFDRRLGRFPYTGLKAGERLPIGPDAVLRGGFSVVVAGRRYGKGSSREHSPLAEVSAGVKLVLAESFERIYRQNADNLGLFTSTNLTLAAQLARGEPIGLNDVLAGRDHLAASVLRSGGLLQYGRQHMRGITPLSDDALDAFHARPRSYFEKIVARHAVSTPDAPAPLQVGQGGFVRADWRFIHEYYTGMCVHMLDEAFNADVVLRDVDSIIAFEDHLGYLHRSEVHQRNGLAPSLSGLVQAHRAFVTRFGVRSHGALPGGEGSEGISHALMTEQYALPGQLLVGTDSHTTHSGAVGCVAFGVGSTDMANAMVTGAVRMTLPESIRIDLQGPLPRGVTAKDIVLHLLADPRIKAGAGVGKVFEFGGTALAELSTDERATLTNMTAELGGFTGLVVPDAETVRFLRERRGVEFALAPWMCSDEGAEYADTIALDCAAMTPMVAAPGDPGNGIALSELAAPVKVDIAYGGSCTAGKREDFDQYHAVLSWAATRGLRVPNGVKLYLQFGTVDVRDYCVERGYLDVFERVGAELLQPSCGACANCGPGASTDAAQVTISAINRNFPGRSGPGQVWLASPPTVAASALAGEIISFDDLRHRVVS